MKSEFEFTNVDMSGARVDFQATNIIHIHANEGNFRIKPFQGNISTQAPNFYPNYFRLRAFACEANDNSSRKSIKEDLKNYYSSKKWIKSYTPNPFHDGFTIEFIKKGSFSIEIFNSLGLKLNTFYVENEQSFSMVNQLESGLYTVRVSQDNTAETLKLIKL